MCASCVCRLMDSCMCVRVCVWAFFFFYRFRFSFGRDSLSLALPLHHVGVCIGIHLCILRPVFMVYLFMRVSVCVCVCLHHNIHQASSKASSYLLKNKFSSSSRAKAGYAIRVWSIGFAITVCLCVAVMDPLMLRGGDPSLVGSSGEVIHARYSNESIFFFVSFQTVNLFLLTSDGTLLMSILMTDDEL